MADAEIDRRHGPPRRHCRPVPDALRVARVELRDPQGAYATVEDLALDWSPLQLLHRRIVIDRLEAARIEAIQMPTGSSSGGAGLPMPVILRALRVARLEVGPALVLAKVRPSAKVIEARAKGKTAPGKPDGAAQVALR